MPDFLAFEQVFGTQFDADTDIAQVARWACREGFAVLPVHPGTKKPLCPLTDTQKRKADREAEEEAREAGKRNWNNVRHSCGVHHALTDPDKAHRAFMRLSEKYPGLNLGIEVGRSRVVTVDCDQARDVKEFAALWAAQSGDPELASIAPTVTSPGVYESETGDWVHKGGGHWHFMLPEGVDFSEAATAAGFKLPETSGAQVYFKDRLILVPPSVREEGPYEFQERACEIPDWLLTRVQNHVAMHLYRRARHREHVAEADDPVVAWASEVPWAALLETDGWNRGSGSFSDCGCEEWTAPGPHDHAKSATAHEAGCDQRDTEDGILHVWTDNPPEPIATIWEREGRKDITKFAYVAWRDHGGDYGQAARTLGIGTSKGYSDGVDDELEMLAGEDATWHDGRERGSERPFDGGTDSADEEQATETELDELAGDAAPEREAEPPSNASSYEADKQAFLASLEGLPKGIREKALQEWGYRYAKKLVDSYHREPEGEGSSWSPIDLTDVLAGEITRPKAELLYRSDGAGMLYPGKLHWVSGEPESGKSWLFFLAAAQCLGRGEDVLYVDYEDAPEQVVGRLWALGVASEDIAARFYYVKPDHAPDAYFDALCQQTFTLAGIDATTESVGSMGYSIKDNDEITLWMKAIPKPLADRTGAAVICVDHVTKSQDDRGRFAIGAQQKLAGVDGVAYVMECAEPIAPGTVGKAALRVAKDKHGSVREHSGPARASDRTQEVAALTFDARDEGRMDVSVALPSKNSDIAPMNRVVEIMRLLDRLDVDTKAGRPTCDSAIRTHHPEYRFTKANLEEAVRLRRAGTTPEEVEMTTDESHVLAGSDE